MMALQRTSLNAKIRALSVNPFASRLGILLKTYCSGNVKGALPSSSRQDAGSTQGPSLLLSRAVNLPLIYAPNTLNLKEGLFEKPFFYRNEKKKKKRKPGKGWSTSKKKESTVRQEEVVLSARNHESKTIQEAIRIFNTIPNDEKNLDKSYLLKAKEKSSSDLINELRNNQAHVLGLSDAELTSRYDFLHSHGLSKVDALKIAIVFPSFLSIESENVEKFLKLFLSFKIDVPRLLQHFPFVFGLNYNDVVRKLEHLGSIGLKKKDVSDLVNQNPILICFDVSDSAKSALKFATGFPGWKSSAGKSSFIESLLKTSLGAVSTKYETDENFTSVASFAVELHVQVSEIFKKCPRLFSTDKEQLTRTLHLLGDEPFFFDTEDMASFIQKYPDIFLQLDQKDVKEKIQRIYKTLGEQAELHNILQHSPKMIIESTCVEKRIELFQAWGFTADNIGYLMNRSPILFIENRVVENLEERLQFILGHGDLTAADVMKFPTCLQMRIVMLRCKIGFIRSVAPDALRNFSLQEIFTAKNHSFAVDICSSSVEQFYSYLKENFPVSDQEWIKKKEKQRVTKPEKESL
ncbi:uncharacterized protein LOC135686487 [Rhopilema esculentum]|uniref:uncharacterized protein LOC135686487 n=1 Tax=Rhopilema esculentum TaxID=499914 RepID=UPI0031D21757